MDCGKTANHIEAAVGGCEIEDVASAAAGELGAVTAAIADVQQLQSRSATAAGNPDTVWQGAANIPLHESERQFRIVNQCIAVLLVHIADNRFADDLSGH